MALGFKIKSMKTQGEYTIEEFYELIKDAQFTAGVPSLTRHGTITLITFPALDRNNQVWVMKAGKNKWSIQKQDEAGINKAVGNALMDSAFGFWGNFKRSFGENCKKCEAQVESTVQELTALGL